jgi:hypothetical protein
LYDRGVAWPARGSRPERAGSAVRAPEPRRGGGDDQRRGAHRGDRRGVPSAERRRGGPGRADRALAEHVRRIRLDNAEAILEANNERTASLYLDGLLDTDEHRRLEADRARAELDHQHARRDVERLHLIVRLLGAQGGEG